MPGEFPSRASFASESVEPDCVGSHRRRSGSGFRRCSVGGRNPAGPRDDQAQAALVTAGWLLLWAASDWRKRRALLVSFTAMMGALLAGTEFLMPGWLWKWRDALLAYMQYIPGQQPQVQFIFGKICGCWFGMRTGGVWCVLLAHTP